MRHVIQGPELGAGAVTPGVAAAVDPDQDGKEAGRRDLRDIHIEKETVLVTGLVEDHEAGL